MQQPELNRFLSLWLEVADALYRCDVQHVSCPDADVRSQCFRNAVQQSFYLLLAWLAGQPIRVRAHGRVVTTLVMGRKHLLRLTPDIDRPPSIPSDLEDELRGTVIAWARMAVLAPEDLGYAFEQLYGRSPGEESGKELRDTHERNARGVFYTPNELVEELCERALAPRLDSCRSLNDLRELAVVDPAMGGGRFLLESAARIAARASELTASGPDARTALVGLEGIYGADRDPLAVDVARVGLWLLSGASGEGVAVLKEQLKCGDSLTGDIEALKGSDEIQIASGDLHWARLFPGVFARARPGFDLVVGNPPWGKLKSEYKRFLTSYHDEVRQLQGAELRRYMENGKPAGAVPIWSRHASEIKEYVARLRSCFGPKHGIEGRGDPDLYRFFMARCFQLVRDGGLIALIIPSAFRNTEGAASLRRLYLENGCFAWISEKTNGSRYFGIHPMFRFMLFVYEKGSLAGIRRMHFVRGRAVSVDVSFNLDELRTLGGAGFVIPEVRSPAEARLLQRLYAAHPPLGQRGSWNVRFVREVDMTIGSGQFLAAHECRRAVSDLPLLPVYEGRMIDQFDYAAKEYVAGAGRTAEWRPSPLEAKRVRPHYYLPVPTSSPAMGRYSVPRAAFCDVTGHANRRTVLAALVPGRVVCGNKVPTCRFEPHDSPLLHLLWVGIANSVVIDWIVRRRISTTLNFFHWYAIPFPRLDPKSKEAKKLALLTASLVHIDPRNFSYRHWLFDACGYEGEPITDKEQRRHIASTIDREVASLFCLDDADLSLIHQDFKHLVPLSIESMPSRAAA